MADEEPAPEQQPDAEAEAEAEAGAPAAEPEPAPEPDAPAEPEAEADATAELSPTATRAEEQTGATANSYLAVEVTAREIRAFRTSQAARRFPALRTMSDEDVAALIVADRASKAARGVRQKVTPRPVVEAPYRPSLRPPVQNEGGVAEKRPNFSPVNPHAARRTVERKGPDSFAICEAPYDEAKEEYLNSLFNDQRNRIGLGFTYNNPSEAKSTIAVNYYLNSPDAETLAMEKEETLRRSIANKESFIMSYNAMRERRMQAE
ncbi:hypothetical protein NFJ02_08g138950 [Pycnococcus provasolii]